MRPSPSMERTVNKVRYRVGNSILLAHDSYWDGSSYVRGGRNVFLYRSPGGRYFTVRLTQWEGERDVIEPIEEDEAYALYERLPEKELPAEEAFPGVIISEA